MGVVFAITKINCSEFQNVMRSFTYLFVITSSLAALFAMAQT